MSKYRQTHCLNKPIKERYVGQIDRSHHRYMKTLAREIALQQSERKIRVASI